jgi:hypothetical protein
LPVQAFGPAIELVVEPKPPEQDFDVTVVFRHRITCSLNVLFGKMEPAAGCVVYCAEKVQESDMPNRRRIKHSTSLEQRIAERASEIRAKAEALPPESKEREKLERTIRQADTFAHMNEWMTSPGLRPPD